MATLYIIRGISGSGKSTLARSIMSAEKTQGREALRFEADDYWLDGEAGYQFRIDELHQSHRQCYQRTKSAMMKDTPVVIVSNTFSTRREVEPYAQLAEKFEYELVVIRMENNFGGNHDVPHNVKVKMQQRFQDWEKGKAK